MIKKGQVPNQIRPIPFAWIKVFMKNLPTNATPSTWSLLQKVSLACAISFLFALRQSNVIGGYSFLLTDLLFLSSDVQKLRLNKSKTGRKLLRSPEQFKQFWSTVQPVMELLQRELEPQTPFSQIIDLKLGAVSQMVFKE